MSDNPFVYDQAHVIPTDLVVHYYIDDHNYGRLLRSRRNVFLVGERGSGKTMALMYNSLPIQKVVAERNCASLDLTYVGVLIPANTPLVHRREYALLPDSHAGILSEHFQALSIMYHLADTLRVISDEVTREESQLLKTELEFYYDVTLPPDRDISDAICLLAQRESIAAQRTINNPDTTNLYPRCLSFASGVMPLMRALRKIRALKNSHFMLMVDDAHSFNQYQVEALNSWLSYRDRSLFSFKVATTRVGQPARTTGGGGTILEGHDFLTVNMERPFHGRASDFSKFATKVVRRRLERVGITMHPEEFFPMHATLKKELEAAAAAVRQRARKLFPESDRKKIADYVYKRKWAEYMRQRDPEANLPMYSGFSTLVYLSTGVIRNLLAPCWWMWDAVVSEATESDGGAGVVGAIPPGIQASQILERSDVTWGDVAMLAQTIDGCSTEDGKKVANLFDKLGDLFVERLMGSDSEPSATSFSISAQEKHAMDELTRLLVIAQKAQLLYVRPGAAKVLGKRENYYVPNRMLWPSRGLDPHGQHARVSLKASDLLLAAHGKPIPFAGESGDEQGLLFDSYGGELG